jgi:phytoene dehydrogenase-like protein
VQRDGFTWDSGPSLLTMPWVLRDLFAATGAPLADELELLRVEPVTRYSFADGTGFDLSADLPARWRRWRRGRPARARTGRGSSGPARGCGGRRSRSSPARRRGRPRRPAPGAPPPDPRDLLRVKPWHTLRTLARAHARDPRLRMVIERFATYAGADPRRAGRARGAGYVEHAFGECIRAAGSTGIVRALAARTRGARRQCASSCGHRLLRRGRRVTGVDTAAGALARARWLTNGDVLAVRRVSSAPRRRRGAERSLSGSR